MQSGDAGKPAAASDALNSSHIIGSKLIPKNPALLVLAHRLDCDSPQFNACPSSSVLERLVLKTQRAKLSVVPMWVIWK